MGRLRAKQDYESLRNARITRNNARLESLGINHVAAQIPSVISSVKSIRRIKRPISHSASPRRRSGRLKERSSDIDSSSPQGDHSEVAEKILVIDPNNKSEVEARIDAHVSEIQIINSCTKTSKRVKKLNPELGTPLRHSDRLKRKSVDIDSSSPQDSLEEEGDHSGPVQESSIDYCKSENKTRTEDHVSGISDYESIRNARISENKARMAALGLEQSIRELQDIISSDKSRADKSRAKTSKKRKKVKLGLTTPLRRSDRLNGKSYDFDCSPPQDLPIERDELSVRVKRRLFFSNSDRCGSKERGSIYDPILGICCHFCRQKKLCGEEDCKRCGNRDMNQPCIGKTECSTCRSANGVLCRGCLKVRYGEEMEEVRKKKDWMCPHCIEEKGINPYWICNSSLCLRKRKMVPTGIAIYHARQEGYESVAHLIMDKLKRKSSC